MQVGTIMTTINKERDKTTHIPNNLLLVYDVNESKAQIQWLFHYY